VIEKLKLSVQARCKGRAPLFLVLKQNLNPFYMVHLVTYSKGRCETSFHPSMSSSIHPSVWPSIHPIMVYLFRQGGERVEYRHAVAGKVKDIVKHHFIHLSHHPFVHSSDHPFVPSWSVYSDGAEKEWNTDAVWRANVLSNTHTCALGTRFKLVH